MTISRQIASEEDKVLYIFHGTTTSSLTDEIIKEAPDLIKKGEITWDKFEDGFPNLFIKNVESIRGRDVVFVVSLLKHDELLAQISVLYSLPRYLVRSMIVVMPYFPTGTMERVDEEGQIATAMTLARLISSAPITSSGPSKLIIYDIHALQSRFYFSDNVIPLLVSAIPIFLKKLEEAHKDEKIVIAFPDDGAAKRFGKQFSSSWPLVTCLKVREGNKRIVKIKEGEEELPGSHVFIVDDLVKTGGTLNECKEVLYSRGAKNVSAFVTHAVFPQDSWKRFVEQKTNRFSKFYITDSCPEVSSLLASVDPFTVLPLAPSIVETLLKY